MKRLTLIPLATPETISPAALRALESADGIYLQTSQHPCAMPAVSLLDRLKKPYGTMDDLYNDSDDFDELNRRIAQRLATAFRVPNTDDINIGYAVLGRGASPELIRLLRELSANNGLDDANHGDEGLFSLSVLPSSGYAEAAIAAAVNAGLADGFSDYNLRTAANLSDADVSVQLVIEEVDTPLRAGELKLLLGEYYPDEHPATVCSMGDDGGYKVKNVPLYSLDFAENASKLDAATVLIIPPCPLTDRSRHGLDGLMEVMYRLRAPGGCPWDAEQTHESLRSSLIEESYEVLDAIDRSDITALEEELGDLLLQIVFHAIIEQERSEFTMRDVTTGIVNKLIYRHPHVFGTVKVKDSDDVLNNWEDLKKKEKHQQTVASAMESVPSSFPALMRSSKIQKKAAHVGFDWDCALDALPKVEEESAEVREAILSGDAAHTAEEVGDLFFACVNVARLLKIDPELALGSATDKFMNRFIRMEQLILSDGKLLEGMSFAELDEYWGKIKK